MGNAGAGNSHLVSDLCSDSSFSRDGLISVDLASI